MSYGPLDPFRASAPPPPRDFGGIIQTCSANVQRIAQSTAQIKNLMSQLGTKQDSSKLQENLQQLQHSANCLAKETNEYLKELGSLPLPLSASEQSEMPEQTRDTAEAPESFKNGFPPSPECSYSIPFKSPGRIRSDIPAFGLYCYAYSLKTD